MILENVKVYADQLKEKFADIDNQLGLVNAAIGDLQTEQKEIEGKSFYLGKAKRQGEIKAELEAAKDELKKIKSQREELLASYNDVNKVFQELEEYQKKNFQTAITSKVAEHVAAINDLIEQGEVLRHQLYDEQRENMQLVTPYISAETRKRVDHSILFSSVDGGIDYEIRSINSNIILK